MIQQQYPISGNSQKQHNQQITVRDLCQLPTDLFIQLLFVSDLAHIQMQFTLFNNQQNLDFSHLQSITNQLILYLHVNMDRNIQVLQQIGKFLVGEQNYSNKNNQLQWIVKYLIRYTYHQSFSHLNLLQFKLFLINASNLQDQVGSTNYWHQLIKNLLISVTLDHSNAICGDNSAIFLTYFEQNIGDQLIAQYIIEPTPTLLEILKKILELCSNLKPKYIEKLRRTFIDLYLNRNVQQLEKQKMTNRKTFNILKLIQLFHIADNQFKISELATNQNFMTKNLYTCLCDFETKGANALAMNIYGAIMKQLQLYNQNIQSFVDLYLTLDCYGMHLIKDIWDRFYVLCRNARIYAPIKTETKYYLFPISSLLHIILCKVEQHPNHNVPKYCIQSLLGASPEDVVPLFEYLQDTVYGSLIQILNTGTHYNDCTHFHQDSKIYTLTKNFYLGYYNLIAKQPQAQTKLRKHLRQLVNAMKKHITFEHCIIGYAGILGELPQVNQVKLFGKQQMQVLVDLTNKFLVRLTFRKRHKLIESILKCIEQNVDLKSIGIGWVMENLVLCLPEQALEIKETKLQGSIPKIFRIIKRTFSSSEIEERIKYLLEESTAAQHELNQNKQEQNYRQSKYFSLQKQLAMLSVIFNWDNHQVQNQLLNKCFTSTLPLLVQSSYTYPAQLASAIQLITNAALFSSKEEISSLILQGENGKWATHLLMIISSNEHSQMLDVERATQCLQLVAMTIVESNSQPICRSYAKFIEYCISQLNQPIEQNYPYYTAMLINSLKFKQMYTKKYKAIEDCLYSLFQSHLKIKAEISPKHRLRIQLLLFCILSHDSKYAINLLNSPSCSYMTELLEYSNWYDFEHFEEFFQFCLLVATLAFKAHETNKINEQKWQTFKLNIFKHLKQTIKNMLHNLEYGINRKDVVSSTECVVKIALMFSLNQQGVDIVKYMLEVGENYWGFQRHTILTLLNQITKMDSFFKIGPGLRKLLSIFICVEQYRGEDTAILLPQHNSLSIYTQGRLHKQSDYDGTSLRFIVIQYIYRVVQKIGQISDEQKKDEAVKFWLQFLEQALDICLADNSKQRMFLTGSHKPKLKHCQLLIAFQNFLTQHVPTHKYNQIVLRLLNAMTQNNLSQIKHYLQTFMIKLLYSKPTQQLLAQVCQKLSLQLSEIQGQNSLLKNVSFMVVAGLVLQLHYHDGLFAIIFASVCSHIAYFRGISQYFCFKLINRVKQMNFKDIKYVVILYQQYLKDQDAIRLTQKLQKIIKDYKEIVHNWNIYDHLIKLKPTINNQVITNDHFIDKLKHIGTQLVKQHKHDDGYMPYKEGWKKIIPSNSITNVSNVQQNQESGSFQRKIDPSLDDIYNFEPNINCKRFQSYLKVIVVSAKHIALYGHMARVGQILGISELSIPNLNILELEDFSNVSVTAEKWLNITQHKFQKIKEQRQQKLQAKNAKVNRKRQQREKKREQKGKKTESKPKILVQSDQSQLIKIVKQHKAQGYKLFMVKKSSNNIISQPSNLQLDKKTILIVDELGYLDDDQQMKIIDQKISFNKFFSYHVQATIFIWQYFKKYNLSIN